jgi:hypothetical protein
VLHAPPIAYYILVSGDAKKEIMKFPVAFEVLTAAVMNCRCLLWRDISALSSGSQNNPNKKLAEVEFAGFYLGLLFDTEYEGNMFHRNVWHSL